MIPDSRIRLYLFGAEEKMKCGQFSLSVETAVTSFFLKKYSIVKGSPELGYLTHTNILEWDQRQKL